MNIFKFGQGNKGRKCFKYKPDKETRYNSTPDMIIERSDTSLRAVYFLLFRSSTETRTDPPPYRTCCAHPSWLATSACCRWVGTPASPCGWSCWCAWTSVPEVHLADSFLTFHPSPANLPLARRGTFGPTPKDQSCLSFFGDAGGKLSWAGGHFRCPLMHYLLVLKSV